MSSALPASAKAKKRKAAVAVVAADGTTTTAAAAAAVSRNNKRRKAAKFEEDEALLDLEVGVNRAFAVMDGQLLADHLARQTRRFGTDLSTVELADLAVSAGAIRDTTAFGGGGGGGGERKDRTKENLTEFLEAFAGEGKEGAKRLGEATGRKGAPHTIVVAGAGMRAADLVRSLRKFQKKGNVVAKLFAKHIKIEEAVKFLENSKTGIGVGTPARLTDLLENGALKVDHLRRIVVDASYIDQKKRGIMDMKETMMPLAKWLARKEFKERYTDSEKPLDLLFY